MGLLEICSPQKSRDPTCMAKTQDKDDKMTMELAMLIWQIGSEIDAFCVIWNLFLQTRKEIHDVPVPVVTTIF
jgi:hypothetical protein